MTAVGTGMLAECELTAAQFTRITSILYDHAGIHMRAGKEGLVRARLAKRLRRLGLPDFEAYLAFVEGEPSQQEFAEMIDALTTNKTSFLREATHFDFLRDEVFPSLSGSIRVWSAGCSSGEEPYTLAMLLNESFNGAPPRDTRILATDISHRVLGTAKAALYPTDVMSGCRSIGRKSATAREKFTKPDRRCAAWCTSRNSILWRSGQCRGPSTPFSVAMS
jgi:chemotaxis protein methyltransferase CheR